MAANATVYKANINIANLNIHYYAKHSLTLAKHLFEHR